MLLLCGFFCLSCPPPDQVNSVHIVLTPRKQFKIGEKKKKQKWKWARKNSRYTITVYFINKNINKSNLVFKQLCCSRQETDSLCLNFPQSMSVRYLTISEAYCKDSRDDVWVFTVLVFFPGSSVTEHTNAVSVTFI